MTFDFFVVLMKHWKAVLAAMVIASLSLYGFVMKSQRDSARAEIAEIQRVANESQQQTEANLDTIRSKIPVMVEQAQANAVSNYRKRLGRLPTTGCVLTVPGGLRPEGSDGQVASTGGTDARPADPVADPAIELAKQCGETTALYNAWRDICKLNTNLCEVKP